MSEEEDDFDPEHPDMQHEEPEHPAPVKDEAEATEGEGEEEDIGELPGELPDGTAEPDPEAVAKEGE